MVKEVREGKEQAMHYDVSEYKNYGASRKNGLQKEAKM